MKYLTVSRFSILVFCVSVNISALAQEIKMSKENSLTEEEIAEAEENLDLEEVSKIFGESSDLEDFEKRLNDHENEISNLDLNEDGEVDYLRVIEKVDGNTRNIYVQAVLAEDSFKTVASLVVVKDTNNEVSVKVIGDKTIYGSNYVIVPAFRRVPVVVTRIWSPGYRVWVSPYRYGHYPSYYKRRTVRRRAAVRRAPARRARKRTIIIKN